MNFKWQIEASRSNISQTRCSSKAESGWLYATEKLCACRFGRRGKEGINPSAQREVGTLLCPHEWRATILHYKEPSNLWGLSCFYELASKVYAREIIIRDRSRFHYYKDGSCSCKDYWWPVLVVSIQYYWNEIFFSWHNICKEACCPSRVLQHWWVFANSLARKRKH